MPLTYVYICNTTRGFFGPDTDRAQKVKTMKMNTTINTLYIKQQGASSSCGTPFKKKNKARIHLYVCELNGKKKSSTKRRTKRKMWIIIFIFHIQLCIQNCCEKVTVNLLCKQKKTIFFLSHKKHWDSASFTKFDWIKWMGSSMSRSGWKRILAIGV